jgi:hypothetical protein
MAPHHHSSHSQADWNALPDWLPRGAYHQESPGFVSDGYMPFVYGSDGLGNFQQAQLEALQANAEGRARQDIHLANTPKTPPFGRIVTPEEKSLAGFKRALEAGHGAYGIAFDPARYPGFDGILARRSETDEIGRLKSAAFSESHRDYDAFGTARRNLALVRNFVLGQMKGPAPGASNDEKKAINEKNRKDAAEMARLLGDACAGPSPSLIGRWWRTVKSLFSGQDITGDIPDFLKEVNRNTEGTALLYDYLLQAQAQDSTRDWRLKPREKTPFSDHDLKLYSRSASMLGITAGMEEVAVRFHALQDGPNAGDGAGDAEKAFARLSAGDKAVSIREAQKILEWLQKSIGNIAEERTLERTIDARVQQSLGMLSAGLAYAEALEEIGRDNPQLLRHPTLLETSRAFDAINLRVQIVTADILYHDDQGQEALSLRDNIERRVKRDPALLQEATLLENLKTLQEGLGELGETLKLGRESAALGRGAHLKKALREAGIDLQQVVEESRKLREGETPSPLARQTRLQREETSIQEIVKARPENKDSRAEVIIAGRETGDGREEENRR